MAMATDAALDTFRARADDARRPPPGRGRQPLHPLVRRGRGDPRRGAPPHRAVLGVQPPVRRGAAAQGASTPADLDTYRAGKEILLNELGVVFRSDRGPPPPTASTPSSSSTEGTVDGGRFRFGAAHFEWLLRFAAPLGLGFDDLGKRRHGTAGHAASSATSCCGSTAPRTRRSPRARATPSSTGRRPGSGRSSSPGSRRSRRASAPTCRWPSGPGTTRSRTSTPPTPPTSWPRRSRTPGFDEERFLAGASRDARRRAGVLGRARARPTGAGGRRDDPAPRARPQRRPAPARRHRPPRVVGRQRPRLRRVPGRRLRLRRRRLRRPRDRARATACRYLLQQGDDPLHGHRRPRTPTRPIADHVRRHGDGIRDIAFLVDDVDAAYDAALAAGRHRAATAGRRHRRRTASSATPPIATYGDTVHTFLDRRRYDGPFAPQFEPTDLPPPGRPDGRASPRSTTSSATSSAGALEQWVGYYEQVFGFDQLVHFDDDQISTEYSALMSTVVWNHDKVVLPINEPAEGRRKSQIEEYLDFYGAPGVQHIALRTDDIVAAVRGAAGPRRALHGGAADVLRRGPASGMAGIDAAVGRRSRSFGILVDRDHDGYLLQIFTETRHRPAHGVLRDHPARGRQGLRRGQLQGAVRGDRARAGPAGQPVGRCPSSSPSTTSPGCRWPLERPRHGRLRRQPRRDQPAWATGRRASCGGSRTTPGDATVDPPLRRPATIIVNIVGLGDASRRCAPSRYRTEPRRALPPPARSGSTPMDGPDPRAVVGAGEGERADALEGDGPARPTCAADGPTEHAFTFARRFDPRPRHERPACRSGCGATTSRQAHVGLPPGTVEEEHGRGGFYGPASHLYRLHAADRLDSASRARPPTAPTTPRRLAERRRRPVAHARCSATTRCRSACSATVPGRPEFLRDADGDELFFVHAGDRACCAPSTGRSTTGPATTCVVPRGTTYRFEPADAHRPARGRGARVALLAARPGPARPPRPVRPGDARGARGRGDRRGRRVHRRREAGRPRHRGHATRSTPATSSAGRATSPRCGSTSTTSARSTSPRYHLPPSAHTTFVADGFVVCTFAPRPMEEDPEALRLPFFHRNVDYDEVIFYHRGEFFSRAGIDEGMLTFHPSGLHHGPQPGARARDAAAAAAAGNGGGRRHGRRGRGDDRRPPAARARAEAARHRGGGLRRELDAAGDPAGRSAAGPLRRRRGRRCGPGARRRRGRWSPFAARRRVGGRRAGRAAGGGDGRPTSPTPIGDAGAARPRCGCSRRCGAPPSIRDFYAFEDHVATARRSRGLEMEPDWYELPVFYFTNPAAVLGPDDDVVGAGRHRGARLRARGGRGDRRRVPLTSTPADWLDVVAGFTVMNDWSARDLQAPRDAPGPRPGQGQGLRHVARPGARHARRAARRGRGAAARGDGGAGQRRGVEPRPARPTCTSPGAS